MKIEKKPPAPPGIASTAYRLPGPSTTVRELRQRETHHIKNVRENILQVPKLKTITLEEVKGIHEFTTQEPGELALQAVGEVMAKRGITGREISLIVDFSTVSRDKNGISLCYKIQEKIAAHNALTIALGNGSCVSLQLAFKMAVSLMGQEPDMKFSLLFAEDRVIGNRYNAPFNLLGDGASALLLEKNYPHSRILDTQYQSIGKFNRILGIQHWEKSNFDFGEFENRIIPMHYKVIRDLAARVLERNQLDLTTIALVLYQNMSINDYRGLIHGLGISENKVYQKGLAGHGHIFGSDLVINYHLASEEGRISPGDHILMISSGAGFSWGVTLVKA
ncbi:MAG: 3-oxoacyl-[acyl-carrier-protein] synthase III C-terminal domain-containing protein [Candidatus Aminicenantes bacterium]|jgi:3-oxoacyl-[acyl-carrier-protein] synthase-3